MKFKTGDKVKFLNDLGGGIVSGIVDEKTVNVMTDDGFEYPVPARELIKSVADNNYEKENTTAERTPVLIKKDQQVDETDYEAILPENLPKSSLKNVMLGFVPKAKSNAGTSDIDMYLINDAAYALVYFIGFRENISWHYLKTGYLEPDTKLYIETFDQSAIRKIKNIHIQLLFIGKGKYYPQEPLDKYIAMDSLRFYKESTFKENNYFHKNALILPVTENLSENIEQTFGEELANAMMEKKQVNEPITNPVSKKSETEEIDLHIEEITDEHSHLSPGEILEIQMSRFYTTLEGGIINNVKKMIFIHGVGNGKLKFEIANALNDKYPDLKYQDASFKEYGFGATMVFLK